MTDIAICAAAGVKYEISILERAAVSVPFLQLNSKYATARSSDT